MLTLLAGRSGASVSHRGVLCPKEMTQVVVAAQAAVAGGHFPDRRSAAEHVSVERYIAMAGSWHIAQRAEAVLMVGACRPASRTDGLGCIPPGKRHRVDLLLIYWRIARSVEHYARHTRCLECESGFLILPFWRITRGLYPAGRRAIFRLDLR